MGLFMNILIIFVSLIILYYIYSYFFGSAVVNMTTMMSAKTPATIPASAIASNNLSSNYTYSLWFYVNDWNYRFGEEKVVLSRLNSDKNPGPNISFGAMENNIRIALSTYPSGSNNSNSQNSTSQVNTYIVKNFQLQKWVNLIVSIYGRTLDVYLDGKLVRTFVLPGISKVSPSSNVKITPNGGFDGATSSFQYWPHATNPQQAYNIYMSGYGGSILGNLFNKYRIKIAFLDSNVEKSSFEI